MRAARLLPERLRRLVPEAFAFGVIGALNSLLYFVIFNATLTIGAVKATVIATVVTMILSYLANRHWTYKHRPRSALRREYTLFLVFNLAGMVIQSVTVGAGKYGLGLNEYEDRLLLNLFTVVGVVFGTIFRFWAYRTFVFLKSLPTRPTAATGPVQVATPASADSSALVDHEVLTHLDPAADLADAVVDGHVHPVPDQEPAAPQPRAGWPQRSAAGDSAQAADIDGLDAEIAAEIAAARRPAGR